MHKIKIISLKGKNNFAKVFKEGSSCSTPFFVLLIKPNNYSNNRLGIIASRKVGNAVTRNKIKRAIKEIKTQFVPLNNFNIDIIIIVRKGIISLERNKLLDLLSNKLSKLLDNQLSKDM